MTDTTPADLCPDLTIPAPIASGEASLAKVAELACAMAQRVIGERDRARDLAARLEEQVARVEALTRSERMPWAIVLDRGRASAGCARYRFTTEVVLDHRVSDYDTHNNIRSWLNGQLHALPDGTRVQVEVSVVDSQGGGE